MCLFGGVELREIHFDCVETDWGLLKRWWLEERKIVRQKVNKYSAVRELPSALNRPGACAAQTPITPSPIDHGRTPCSRPPATTGSLHCICTAPRIPKAHTSRCRHHRAKVLQASPLSRQIRRPHPIEMPSTSTASPLSRFSNRPKVSNASSAALSWYVWWREHW